MSPSAKEAAHPPEWRLCVQVVVLHPLCSLLICLWRTTSSLNPLMESSHGPLVVSAAVVIGTSNNFQIIWLTNSLSFKNKEKCLFFIIFILSALTFYIYSFSFIIININCAMSHLWSAHSLDKWIDGMHRSVLAMMDVITSKQRQLLSWNY